MTLTAFEEAVIDHRTAAVMDAVLAWQIAMDVLTNEEKRLVAAFIRASFANAKAARLLGVSTTRFTVALHRIRAKVHKAWAERDA